MKLKGRILLGSLGALSIALISGGTVLLVLRPFQRTYNEAFRPGIQEIMPIPEKVSMPSNGAPILDLVESKIPNLEPGYLLNVEPSEAEKAQDARLLTLQKPIEMLKEKIINRLGFGPEIGMLNGIKLLGSVNAETGDTMGFYTPSTYQIFINMQAMYRRMLELGFIQESTVFDSAGLPTNKKTYGLLSSFSANLSSLYDAYRVYYDTLTETIFQTIYHEYGHHMNNVYLNTDNPLDNNAGDPTLVPQRIYLKNSDGISNSSQTELWDANFYNTFVKTLGYDDSYARQLSTSEVAANGYDNTWQFDSRTRTYGSRTQFTRTRLDGVRPLSNLYSLKQLFDKSNLLQQTADGQQLVTANGLYANLESNRGYTWYNPNTSPSWNFSALSAGTLIYRYSLQELATRKMMQATMPFHSSNARYGYNANGLIVGPRGSSLPSTFLEDTTSYANSVNNAELPFYQDYLFAPHVQNGQTTLSNSHAQSLYKAFTTRMGYQTGDDISQVWWRFENYGNGATIENDTETKAGGIVSNIPNRTNYVKFGGYLNQANVGADWNEKDFAISFINSRGTQVDLPINVFQFNYFVKNSLTASTRQADPTATDPYFYTLKDWASVGPTPGDNSSNLNNILNKKLYLTAKKKDAGNYDWTNRILLRSANLKASTDASTWALSSKWNFTSERVVTATTATDETEGVYATLQNTAKAGLRN